MKFIDEIIEKKFIRDGESNPEFLDKNIERKLYFIEQFLQVTNINSNSTYNLISRVHFS